MESSASELRQFLLRFASDSNPDLSAFTAALRTAFLNHGSSTPDNLSGTERVEIGAIQDSGLENTTGLRLVSNHASLSAVLNVMEGTPIPPQVTEMMPTLQQEDFDAALRIATLCLTALENSPSPAITS